MNASLAELFPDGDHRFHLTLRRAEPQEFFRPCDPSGGLLIERARWLAAEPERYAGLQPEGASLLRELSVLAENWGAFGTGGGAGTAAAGSIHGLGGALEPDVLLLVADDEGRFRLRGGAVCFPTGWALQEKMGQTLDFIHGVVPGLNSALGSPLQQFLSKLKPGVAFLRENWGLAATNELNLHPARRLPPPAMPVALDRLWLRVEHQALVALPETSGVAFGIRIALHRLDTVAGTRAGAGLRRALESMPVELAVYKRIECIRKSIIAAL